MDSNSDCEIIGVVTNTPPISQRLGTFTLTLPNYVLTRPTQDVPFTASPSNVIQTMKTHVWDLVSKKGATPVKFIIYPGLSKGTFSKGWKKVLEINQFNGGDRLVFVVPDQLISEGTNGLMWVAEAESVELQAFGDLID